MSTCETIIRDGVRLFGVLSNCSRILLLAFLVNEMNLFSQSGTFRNCNSGVAISNSWPSAACSDPSVVPVRSGFVAAILDSLNNGCCPVCPDSSAFGYQTNQQCVVCSSAPSSSFLSQVTCSNNGNYLGYNLAPVGVMATVFALLAFTCELVHQLVLLLLMFYELPKWTNGITIWLPWTPFTTQHYLDPENPETAASFHSWSYTFLRIPFFFVRPGRLVSFLLRSRHIREQPASKNLRFAVAYWLIVLFIHVPHAIASIVAAFAVSRSAFAIASSVVSFLSVLFTIISFIGKVAAADIRAALPEATSYDSSKPVGQRPPMLFQPPSQHIIVAPMPTPPVVQGPVFTYPQPQLPGALPALPPPIASIPEPPGLCSVCRTKPVFIDPVKGPSPYCSRTCAQKGGAHPHPAPAAAYTSAPAGFPITPPPPPRPVQSYSVHSMRGTR